MLPLYRYYRRRTVAVFEPAAAAAGTEPLLAAAAALPSDYISQNYLIAVACPDAR